MRRSILLFCLVFSKLLFSQDLETAEWQLVGGAKVSGFANIPLNGIVTSSDVLLKKGLYGKPFRENSLMYLKIGADTLIEYGFYEGWNYRFFPIVKGKVSLYRALSKERKLIYFWSLGDSFVLIDKKNMEATYSQFTNIDCNNAGVKNIPFYLFSEKELIRQTKELNRCIDENQGTRVLGQILYKSNVSLGIQIGGVFNRKPLVTGYLLRMENTRIKRFYLGFERQLGSALSPFYCELQMSYNKYHGQGGSYTFGRWDENYKREIDVHFANLTGGFRLEMFPRRSFSPYVFAGIGLSFPFKFVRTLSLKPGGVANGLPNYHRIQATLPVNKGFYSGIGIKTFINPRYSLAFTARMESFGFKLDLRDKASSWALLDLNKAFDFQLRVLWLGILLKRTF